MEIDSQMLFQNDHMLLMRFIAVVLPSFCTFPFDNFNRALSYFEACALRENTTSYQTGGRRSDKYKSACF